MRGFWIRIVICIVIVVAAVGVSAGVAGAQTDLTATSRPATRPAVAMIRLRLPEELQIKLLIEYVSKRLGMNILCSESIGTRRITLLAPEEIPADSLLDLLRSVLKMADLALVDADQPGWKKIVTTKDLLSVTGTPRPPGSALPEGSPTVPVTQIFAIRHAQVAEVEKLIRLFLTKPGGNSFPITNSRLLVVTDYAGNLRRVASMIELVDKPGRPGVIRFIPVEHLDAGQLATQVSDLLGKKAGIDAGGRKTSDQRVSLSADRRTNQIVMVAPEGEGAEAEALIRQLDVATDVEMRSYVFRYVTPQRIEKLARDLAGPREVGDQYKSTVDAESGRLFVTAGKTFHERIAALAEELDVPDDRQMVTYRPKHIAPRRLEGLVRSFVEAESDPQLYRAVADEEFGLLIVTAPEAVHERIASLIAELDVVPDEKSSPVRFYKLVNTTAAEVLATIRALESDGQGLERLSRALPGPSGSVASPGAERFTGPNKPPAAPGEPPPPPPFYKDPELPTTRPAAGGAPESAAAVRTARTRDAMVTVDTNTNTLIVVAPPAVQAVYEKLIRMLDKRRPQVMVEVILVTLDTSGGFSLGVDMAHGDTTGDRRHLVFSVFGLSEIDVAAAGVTLMPGTGFNGAIIHGDTFSAVVRALSTSGRSKVVAAPKILVNDNASATLSSVSEAPYTSVNATTTVSSVSFAGYASAGITVTLTPRISEGDHLNLQYSVTLNSFTGEGGSGVPPPRQTNTLNSEVTIPDGSAVIVGGLTRKDSSRTASKLPLLGEIPILKYLFGSHTRSDSQSTLFVFIRPVILRDDAFADLKYLSADELAAAEMPPEYPAGEPILMP